jgi:hypothetical protein
MKMYEAEEVYFQALLTMTWDKDEYTALSFGHCMSLFSVDMNYSKRSSKDKSPSFVFFLFESAPGVWILCADVSKHSVFHIPSADTTHEDGTDTVFRNVGK